MERTWEERRGLVEELSGFCLEKLRKTRNISRKTLYQTAYRLPFLLTFHISSDIWYGSLSCNHIPHADTLAYCDQSSAKCWHRVFKHARCAWCHHCDKCLI